MEEALERLWELALPYQDKRDDEGHARIVVDFSIRLLDLEGGDPAIVIPAATGHDTGWSQLPEEERFLALRPETDRALERTIRMKHQEEGVKVTRRLLEEVGYDKALTEQILEIISQHDTRVGSFSKEDAIMRDADKLWRFSVVGFAADLRRTSYTPDELYRKIKGQVDKPGFFFTESARALAREELKVLAKHFHIEEGGVD